MTLRYVYGQDRNVARFVAQLIPHVDPRGFPANATAIGITDEQGTPVGGIVFFNHIPPAGTIEIAIAAYPGTRWLTRETMHHMASHTLGTHGCQMVIMRVRADDLLVLRQLKLFGFSMTPIARLYGRNDDGMFCTYTAEQWAESRFNRPLEAEIHRKVA